MDKYYDSIAAGEALRPSSFALSDAIDSGGPGKECIRE